MKLLLLVCQIIMSVFGGGAMAQYSPTVYRYNAATIEDLCSMVDDSTLSFKHKITTLKSYDVLSLHCEYSERLLPLYRSLLAQSRKRNCPNGKIYSYSSIADLYTGLDERAAARLYLDSAESCIAERTRTSNLGIFYRVKADYLHKFEPYSSPETFITYQTALDYYIKSGVKGREEAVVKLLHNLALGGVQRGDTAYISKTVDKMDELGRSFSSPLLEFARNDVTAGRYWVSFNLSGDSSALDSVISCLRRSIEAWNTGLIYHAALAHANDLLVIYATMLTRTSSPDIDAIDSLLDLAANSYRHGDLTGYGRLYYAKARLFMKLNMLDSTEIMALRAFDCLKRGERTDKFSTTKINTIFLRDVYLQKGDYEKVMLYDDMLTSFDDEMRHLEVKEKMLQYQSDIKKQELELLYAERHYRHNRHVFFIIICTLLFFATLFYSLSIKLKRDSMKRSIALMDKENEALNLKLKLKEEQEVKRQLERYELMSDFYLKEVELVAKEKDLAQLRRDKEKLDMQVEEYRHKLEGYEKSLDVRNITQGNLNAVILGDLRRLLEEKLPDKPDYIRKMSLLNNSFTELLRTKSENGISTSYIKYCICFFVGMSIHEVAECFGIEPTSAHMIRYRLKKMFKLGNNDDLDTFLIEALTSV
jgi:hypothetical protein